MTVTFTVLVTQTGLYVMVWQCVHGSMCVSGTKVVDVMTRSSSRGLSEVTTTVRFSSLKSIFKSMVGTVVATSRSFRLDTVVACCSGTRCTLVVLSVRSQLGAQSGAGWSAKEVAAVPAWSTIKVIA